MRIVNRIVNILILIFAITAAVFSYLLFEKREIMVDGWKKMAKTISQSAKALDEKSGTKFAADLTSSSLNYKNFTSADLSDLEQKLSKLPSGAKTIVAQRDSLADTLQKVAEKNEIKGVSAADLKRISTSPAKQKFIVSEFNRIIQRNNHILNNYKKHSNDLGVNLSISEIKESPDTASRSLQKAIDDLRTRLKAGDEAMTSIGVDVGVYPNLRNSDYAGEMQKVRDGVKKLKADISRLKKELSRATKKNSDLASSLDDSKKLSKQTEEQLEDQQKQIAELRKKLYGSIKPPTDAELYATVQGRVENVNNRWKFIVINLGSQMPTIKKNKTDERMFMIPLMKGFVMTVARKLDSGNPEYIGKIVIAQVGNNYAIANIETNSLQSEVKAGDIVYFTEEDTASNLKFRESISNKK